MPGRWPRAGRRRPDGRCRPRYDFGRTVGALADVAATTRVPAVADGAFWWATRTPDGPGTLRLRRDRRRAGRHRLRARAPTGWSPRPTASPGCATTSTGFAELAGRHPLVADLARRHRGLRLAATGRVFQRLLRAVFEQKVTGKEAYRAYAATVRHFAGQQPAPGPLPDLRPAARPGRGRRHAVLGVPPVRRRAEAGRHAAAGPPLVADRLEACADADDATARLTAIRGIGAWTAAEVTRVVFGDPDAVSVGDFHIPHMVAWAPGRRGAGRLPRRRSRAAGAP